MKKVVIFLLLITWPLSLLLNNTFPNFLNYAFPFFEPKFVILPFLFLLLYSGFKYKKLLLLFLILTLLFWKPFFGQTIFVKDYEAEQQILQKTFLYPNIPLARLFQNKPRIILDKFTNNFFAIIDPNNYFFGFAPRQITINNQNLKKFPFLSLTFLVIGLFNFKKIKHYKLLLAFLAASIFNLSLLTNFDRHDFILWIPLFFIILHGLTIFATRFKYTRIYFVIFIIFSSLEILRLFLL